MRYFPLDKNQTCVIHKRMPEYLSQYKIKHSKVHYCLGDWGEYVSQEGSFDVFRYLLNMFHLKKVTLFSEKRTKQITTLVYMLKGSITLKDNNQQEILNNGYCYLCYFPPKEIDYLIDPGLQYWFVLEISTTYLKKIETNFKSLIEFRRLVNDGHLDLHVMKGCSISRTVKQLIKDICNNKEDSPERELRLGSYGRSLLASFMEAMRKPGKENNTSVDYKMFEEYVDSNIENSITISNISREFALNKTEVKKRFRTLFNKTVHGYILQRRLDHARNMLLTTKDSVYLIALKTGFTDPSHFIKAFKSAFGTTPAIYRKCSL